jgi:hypothetical protein
LKKAAKGSSVAALIASGALDFELKKILFAAEKKYLSREALEGPLATKSLELIRDLLKGEFEIGGKFFKRPGGKGDSAGPTQCGDGTYCYGDENCPWDGNCPSDGCTEHICGSGDGLVCGDDYTCEEFGCAGVNCPTVSCGEYAWRNYDDIGKKGGSDGGSPGGGSSGGGGSTGGPYSGFYDELFDIMLEERDLSLKEFEITIINMIRKGQTLKDKGYVRR